ncbi:MAG: hypothetical protein ACXVZX_08550 [Terriglobales bacterium]
MTLDSSWSAYIFRDGKVAFSGRKLVKELADRLHGMRQAAGNARWSMLVDVLLRAGELECALRDTNSPDAATAERVTETIAHTVVNGAPLRSDEAAAAVATIVAPEDVKVAPPEGFAYYSLHPLDMPDLVRQSAPRREHAAVVGIRSIGTTLSALVHATLRGLDLRAERTTVRPVGHPYNRETHFSEAQLSWIANMRSHRATFFVVDEGPGMSGSSFLSVGDALLSAGVPRSEISFLCTRRADPATLTANNAAERWPAFNAYYTQPTRYLPTRAKEYIAGGIWRAKAFALEEQWPASWIQMERLKFLSEDGNRLFRFEGFGRFGEELRQRAAKVAEFGFGPLPDAPEQGFGVYPVVRGRYLSANDGDASVLDRIAEYCAFRARALATNLKDTPELETMLRFNTQEEFGVELPADLQRLPFERPVVADGRMLPHKWIDVAGFGSSNGSGLHPRTLFKIDCASHGDDHFFPGPTDIAWDLAGAILEWRLDAQAASYLLGRYRAYSADDPSRRLPVYLLAYATFRTAYCKMASAAMKNLPECPRMLREYHSYRGQAARLLREFASLPPISKGNNAQVA